MKKNIITSIINWRAKKSSPILFLFVVLSIVFACRKSGNFNLGNARPNSYAGIVFSDTFTVHSTTMLLNDSLVSATSSYLNFGYYEDPVMGNIFSEAYCALSLQNQGVSYSGAQVDSSYLYISCSYVYGDTNMVSSVSVHEVTTQMGLSVPYLTTSNFITYNSSVDAVYQNTIQPPLTAFTSPVSPGAFTYQMYPNSNNRQLQIPIANSFATYLLGKASNLDNSDFGNIFYGLVIKNNNNWTNGGSVARASFTSSDYYYTRLIVYYHVGNQADSASFGLNSNTPSFNRVIPQFTGALANLKNNTDSVSPNLTNGNCFIQSGTGVVTKIQIPYLAKLQSNDTSVIINKALLVVPIESTPPESDLRKYPQNSPIALVELNPDNSYKYRPTGLALIQSTGATQYATGRALTDTATSPYTTQYAIDITSYVQAILSNKANGTTYIVNNGFAIISGINSYLVNRSVIHSSTAVSNPMKLELYYTKVK